MFLCLQHISWFLYFIIFHHKFLPLLLPFYLLLIQNYRKPPPWYTQIHPPTRFHSVRSMGINGKSSWLITNIMSILLFHWTAPSNIDYIFIPLFLLLSIFHSMRRKDSSGIRIFPLQGGGDNYSSQLMGWIVIGDELSFNAS